MPHAGSGEGITEYAYNIANELREYNLRFDLIYAREKRNSNSDWVRKFLVNKFIFLNDFWILRKKLARIKSAYDLVHITNQEMGFASEILKRKNIAKSVVTTIHDLILFNEAYGEGIYNKLVRQNYYGLVRKSIDKAVEYSDFLIFDSTQTKDEAVKVYGRRIKKNEIINLGIPDIFIRNALNRRTVKSKLFRVGYIGALTPRKNVSGILKSAYHLKYDRDTEFLVYGKGQEYESLNKYRVEKGLSNVSFNGFVEEDKKIDAYDSFDAFVFPSLYEGFGLPILEAQARGLPVIIYKNSKIPEEVGRYCFKVEDDSHMAQIIESIKNNGYVEGKRIKAWKYARGFTWEKCAGKTLQVYKKVNGIL